MVPKAHGDWHRKRGKAVCLDCKSFWSEKESG